MKLKVIALIATLGIGIALSAAAPVSASTQEQIPGYWDLWYVMHDGGGN